MSAEDYPYIRMSGKFWGSMRHYIESQIEQARHDGAPPNAVDKTPDGTWRTTDDILSDDTRQRYGLDPFVITPDNINKVAHAIGDGLPHGASFIENGATWQVLRFANVTQALDFARFAMPKLPWVNLAEPITSLIMEPVLIKVQFA